ncbi:MCM DNA helicase complex subunit [Clydaea vesicula]|uniref:DNA replication licensing factor MCM3 n=1 Tax=Clydaea vesicula TaxID=447962 RepID=A0AAD5UB05_9FUNG|nr:MCM DNA helicase complex subunit [Clydaea vesicula]
MESIFLTDDLLHERTRVFREFLDNDYGETIYRENIKSMLQKDKRRLIVNLNHVRQFNRDYAEGLLNHPIDYLPAFEKALLDIVQSYSHDNTPLVSDTSSYSIGLEGSFGNNKVSMAKLNSNLLGKLISIQGIVTRCSLVRPKVVRSVHYCEKTQQFHSREYRDQTQLGHQLPTSSIYPKEDENGNPLTTEFGLSTYRGTQTISIQEMPERAPAGQMPHPVDVILDYDLADTCKPGDRIQIVGVYRSLGRSGSAINSTFKTLILANHIKQLGKSINRFVVSEKDVVEIKKLSKKKNIFELLSSSLAPSIFGHEYIKKAVLLQMLGGMEKNLDNGTHIRGDINILMVGDPSTAKSQMLRFVLNIAPLAIATTGRGTSGVGLTAAVTMDKDTGERRLEAGAMVLADRGIVCIDEFDKMNDIDRVAIHEVMEQQTVTIAKAGIHTSLNARCSVIAAANPVMGQYIDTKEPSKNINLPDSLLSRFDLLFIVLDNLEDEHNRAIAEHVVRMHRYVSPGTEEGMPINEDTFEGVNSYSVRMEADMEDNEATSVFEKFDELLHIGLKPLKAATEKRNKKSKKGVPQFTDLISIPFIKKYIQHAKLNVKPALTQEAADLISSQYSELRAWEDGREKMYRVMPITARTLETLIRLSTAHAKCRLSEKVEESDVEVALEVLEYALYKEVKMKPRKMKKPKVDKDHALSDDTDDGDSSNEEFEEDSSSKNQSLKKENASISSTQVSSQGSVSGSSSAKKKSNVSSSSQLRDGSELLNSNINTENGDVEMKDADVNPEDISGERMKFFEQKLSQARNYVQRNKGVDGEMITLDDCYEFCNMNVGTNDKFSDSEIRACLKVLNDDNRIWFRESEGEVLFM